MAHRASLGPRVRSRTLSSLTAWIVAIAALAALAALVVPSWSNVGPLDAPTMFADPTPPVGPMVDVVPGSWAMTAGDSVSFTAMVTGIPPGCSLGPAEFRWSLPGLSEFEGLLNLSVGDSTRFTASPSASGAANILAQATGSYRCGDVVESLSTSGTAGLGITPRVIVGNLATYPNPATPGGRVVLQWTMSGGTAPYSASVSFGDGTATVLAVGSVGSPFIAHRYPAGVFTPQVEVVDSLGHQVPSTVIEPLVVTNSLAVAISLATVAVDPGVAFTVSANVSGGVPPIAEFWSDSLGDFGAAANWTITAPSPGNITLGLEVLDGAGNTMTVRRTVTVEPGPSVSVLGTRPTADVGMAFPVSIVLRGGVGPYAVNWSVVGGNANDSVTLPGPGTLTEPVVSLVPGEVWVTAHLRDAAGSVRSTTVPVTQAFEPPRATALISQPTVEVGRSLTLTAVLDQGAPPLNWSFVTSVGASNGTPSRGSIAGPGTLRWEGAFVSAGTVDWFLQVTDSAGAVTTLNGSVGVLPALQAQLGVPRSGAALQSPTVVSAVLSGGLPPYRYDVAVSDGEVVTGNLSQPGTARFNVSPAEVGNLSVSLRVTDGLGVEVGVSSALPVLSAPSTPPSAPTATIPPTSGGGGASTAASWGVGLGGLCVAAAVFLVPRWRQRSKRPQAGGPDARAMAAVRRLLRGTDGLERETLYFLAEEEAVTTDAAAAAVDRWNRAGRIRVESGLEGQDLLMWTEPGASPAASDLPPEPEAIG